jgi:hypothetical protein
MAREKMDCMPVLLQEIDLMLGRFIFTTALLVIIMDH